MNLIKSSLALAALVCASGVAFANEEMEKEGGHHRGGHHGMMGSHMKSMDTNSDGLITKAEFMAAQEAKWEKMPKNSAGALSIADMEKAHQERMKTRHADKHEAMSEQHEEMMEEHEEAMDAKKKDPAH